MVVYHVNNNGETGLCAAEVRCPFGGKSGLENHFSTEQEAREFYETKNQDTVLKSLNKNKIKANFITKKTSQKLIKSITEFYKKSSNDFYYKTQKMSNSKLLHLIAINLGENDYEVRESIAKNPIADKYTLELISQQSFANNSNEDAYVLINVCTNPNTNLETLEKIYDKYKNNFTINDNNISTDVKTATAINKNASEELLLKMISDSDPKVIGRMSAYILESRDNLSLDLQYELVEKDNKDVYMPNHEIMSKNEKIDSSVLKLIYEKNKNVDKTVRNMSTEDYIKVGSLNTLKNLLNNPNTPQEIKDKIQLKFSNN